MNWKILRKAFPSVSIRVAGSNLPKFVYFQSHFKPLNILRRGLKSCWVVIITGEGKTQHSDIDLRLCSLSIIISLKVTFCLPNHTSFTLSSFQIQISDPSVTAARAAKKVAFQSRFVQISAQSCHPHHLHPRT